MNPSSNVLYALGFALFVTGMLVALSGGDPGDSRRPGVPTNPPGPSAASSDGAERPAAGKVISLSEAVTIAERIGKGYATKAERRDRPELCFKVEVMSRDGSKTRVELDANGKVKESIEDEPEPKRPDKKPKEKNEKRKPAPKG